MTQTTTNQAAQVAGYLKQWRFDPNQPRMRCGPSRASPDQRPQHQPQEQPGAQVPPVGAPDLRHQPRLDRRRLPGDRGPRCPAGSSPDTRTTAPRSATEKRWPSVTASTPLTSTTPSGLSASTSTGPHPTVRVEAPRRHGAKRCGPATGWRSTTPRPASCLIDFDRTVGGDIGWPSSETWGQQIEDAVMRASGTTGRKPSPSCSRRDPLPATAPTRVAVAAVAWLLGGCCGDGTTASHIVVGSCSSRRPDGSRS